jgi:hypothetical protein
VAATGIGTGDHERERSDDVGGGSGGGERGGAAMSRGLWRAWVLSTALLLLHLLTT